MGVDEEKNIKLLGKLVVEYSNLILGIDILSCELFGIEQDRWQIFSSKISDRVKIECFGEILKLRKSEQYFTEIDNVLKRLNVVEQHRNTYLHSAYMQTLAGQNMRIKFAKELEKPAIFDMNYDELEKLIEDIILLRKDSVSLVR